MIIFIIIVCLLIVIINIILCIALPQDNDLEDQLKAINKWKEKRKKGK